MKSVANKLIQGAVARGSCNQTDSQEKKSSRAFVNNHQKDGDCPDKKIKAR